MTLTAESPALRSAIEDRVEALSAALASHAGGLELQSASEDGTVTVRFTGMCTGCPLRPVSFNGLVKPLLMAVAGVREVHAEGGRISAEAEERLSSYLTQFGSECLGNSIRSLQGRSP